MKIGEFEKGADVSQILSFPSSLFDIYFIYVMSGGQSKIVPIYCRSCYHGQCCSADVQVRPLCCLVLPCLINTSFQRVLLCATGCHCCVLCMEVLRLKHISWHNYVLFLYRAACNDTSSPVFIPRWWPAATQFTVHEIQRFRNFVWIVDLLGHVSLPLLVF